MAELPEYFEFAFTITGTYKVPTDSIKFVYGVETAEEAAKVDEQNLRDYPDSLDFFVDGSEDIKFEVKPVDRRG